MSMRGLICIAAASLLPAIALAGSAGDVESVSLTVYNDNLALIREVRPLTLDQGVQQLVLSEVSGMLQPETVHLSVQGGLELALLEQNYDYDLVSSDKLLAKFIGKEIILADDAKGTNIRGKLLSTSGGMVVDADGQILLNPPGRVILPPEAAGDLLLRPTLSWLVNSPRAGDFKAEVTYLSQGISWQADYVLLLAADDRSGGLEGWVTLSNSSGTTYKDAALKLVAGEVHRVREQLDYKRASVGAAPEAAADGGFAEEQFFEYHLYDLQRPTTIRNNQQKQIGLLTANKVPVKKLYLFDGINGGDVRVVVQFKNDEASGMGMPLPEGTVRLFKQDSKGQAQFVGEDRIKHTPKEEEVRLNTGNAFDIKGEASQMDYKDIGNGYTATYKVKLKNHKEHEDAVITVTANIYGDWQITSSNFDYVKKDAWTAEFNVPVKADGEAELTYAVKVVWR